MDQHWEIEDGSVFVDKCRVNDVTDSSEEPEVRAGESGPCGLRLTTVYESELGHYWS